MWFDQNGQFINTSGLGNVAGAVPPAADFHKAGNAPSGVGAGNSGDLLGVSVWSTPAGANNAAPTGPGTGAPAAIGLDFSNMTALATAATANTVSQNGYAAGILSNITIGQDGTITGAFTNGQNTTLGKLALATFAERGWSASRPVATSSPLRRTRGWPNTASPPTG